jgi:1D-myo-inositol-tetrakisphosphate 5-kinase/inositol-polyphosphate multikinase
MHCLSSEGLRCHSSGSFIAKPCTPQEIAFYESASAYHPEFAEFMPIYIGTLKLSSTDPQQPLALAAAEHGGAIVLPASETSSSTDTPTAAEVPAQNAVLQQEVAWTPSGGRKLETGLAIVLENVASGFRRPNVLDVKLGSRLWADDAPPAKRTKLDAVSRETTSSTLGFRIAGMKVWTGEKGEEFTDPYMTKYEGAEGDKGQVIEKNGYRRYDKWYGRTFTAENVKEGFQTFLAGAKAGKVDRSKLIARRLAEELRHVQLVLESEESRMYSASVLIIYEGDPDALEQALEEEKKIKEIEDDISETETEHSDHEKQTSDPPAGEDSFEVVGAKFADEAGSQSNLKLEIDTQSMQLRRNAEGGVEEEEDDDEEEEPKVHDLRLIDFAHASWTPGHGPDENALKGVRSLLKIMEELSLEEEER